MTRGLTLLLTAETLSNTAIGAIAGGAITNGAFLAILAGGLVGGLSSIGTIYLTLHCWTNHTINAQAAIHPTITDDDDNDNDTNNVGTTTVNSSSDSSDSDSSNTEIHVVDTTTFDTPVIGSTGTTLMTDDIV